ncbi:MAG TPA: L-rhamnose/proton symporter RhaT [Bacteroidales bacterium]|nr:L-rhamnose/proton symporter RhaT [Bacteroidales bacterium]HOG56996.1 L-rhamnose/proton symporter RhaT [Bacteroidales bacterium]HPX43879.1 L-rhamnose/proton symporter RhaT [Bacteroidales bacterium]HQB87064.1 L-rhamnose/proton symporter RhaT [Bacteroidales bacterium]
MDPVMSILLMSIGSICAASFYVPIKKIKGWSWESYWLVQGIFSWIIVPILFAWLTVPSGTLGTIISEAPSSSKWMAVFYGALWGVGGLTFGLTMRYLGVALGQSIALGLCAAIGTILPPIISGNNLFASRAGILILIGVTVSIVGISIIGYAGSLKSKNMSEEDKKAAVKDFALKKGILIAILSGVMSACFNFGLTAGEPIRQAALANGTNALFAKNPVIMFVTLGGFFTNLIYCVFLNVKNKSYKDYLSVSGSVLFNNIFFAMLGGTLWYMQFFFMGMGESKLPAAMMAFSWSILMSMNITFSNIWGILLKEWKGAGRKTITVLVIGLVVLVLSTFVIKL